MKRNVLKVLGALVLPAVLAGQVLAEAPSFSGFVDFGYNYNFNGMQTNNYRTFDANANSLTLQNAEIVAEGKNGDYGYRVDVNYGFDAAVIHSAVRTTPPTPNGGGIIAGQPTTLQIDLQQAFVTAPCPWTNGTVTFGKFVTPFGAEVIEAKDNYNTSRGLLFNYAIPVTHTGIKYDKAWADGKWNTGLGIVNGWDQLQDVNKGKSVIATLGYTASEKLSVIVGGITGPEQAAVAPPAPSIEKNSRSLVDALVKIAPSDKLSLVLNWDWGVEEGLVPAGADTTQNWAGLGAHLNYKWNDKLSTAARWETFDDEGSRTGVEQVLNSLTLTLQCKHDSGIMERFEFRQDGSSDMVFFDDDGLADDAQSTVSYQVILPF